MKRLIIFLVPMCLILSAQLSRAQRAVTVGGGWQFFEWNNAPGSFNVEGAFTFTSASSTLLTITDTGVDGDRFSLFDFGTLIGTTSVPANDGYDNETLTPDQTLTDPRYSHGFFPLSPGNHSITIQIIEAARGYSGGGADFRVDVVPEPTTLSFLAVALGIFAFRRRRRNVLSVSN
jgi:hypothetical protein